MALEIIRWGILGCGDVCEKKSGPALYMATASRLVAVMRRDIALAQDFAARHGSAQAALHPGAPPIAAYCSVAALLADPDVDAVYIATPPHLHAEHVLAAVAAGKKRILCEKPMALSTAECERMNAVCAAAGASLHVAYYRRAYPKFGRARELLRTIGTITGARFQMCALSDAKGWRVDPAVSGGGYFHDVGSHRLDALSFLLGEDVAVATGFGANLVGHHAGENDVVIALRMTSGALVSGGFHYHTLPPRDVLEIYGTTGSMTLDPFDGDVLKVSTAGGGEATVLRIPNPPAPVHLPYVQTLVDTYRGVAAEEGVAGVLVSGEDGLKTTRVMEAVLRGGGK